MAHHRAMRFFFLLPLSLSACTSLNTRLPELPAAKVKAEKQAQEKAVFKSMSEYRDRLHRVAYPILRANAELCPKTQLDSGLVTATATNYAKELRAAARRELGVSNDPKVIYVRPGSAGQKAGIRASDMLQTEEGKPLGAGKPLEAVMQSGGNIRVMRGEDSFEKTLKGEEVCGYALQLKMTSAINAYATGKSIVMTAGMMEFVKSDDELAYIIGHELAHNTQSHIRKSITNYVLSLGGTRYTRPFEAEADYVGIYYMERAGYNSDNVEDMWRRLAKLSARPIGRAKTHPAYPTRTVQIKATREEIEQKRAANVPMRPELRRSGR